MAGRRGSEWRDRPCAADSCLHSSIEQNCGGVLVAGWSAGITPDRENRCEGGKLLAAVSAKSIIHYHIFVSGVGSGRGYPAGSLTFPSWRPTISGQWQPRNSLVIPFLITASWRNWAAGEWVWSTRRRIPVCTALWR